MLVSSTSTVTTTKTISYQLSSGALTGEYRILVFPANSTDFHQTDSYQLEVVIALGDISGYPGPNSTSAARIGGTLPPPPPISTPIGYPAGP
jgi:hypothetical protein